MSFIYKTILKAENTDFDLVQNRRNSKQMIVIAIDRKTQKTTSVLSLDKKDGKIFLLENNFKQKTIDKLISAMANFYNN